MFVYFVHFMFNFPTIKKTQNQCVTINKTLKEAIYAQKNTAKPFFFS